MNENITQVLLCHILETIQASLGHILETVSIKVYLVIPFSGKAHITETSQLICNANKSTDFYTIRVPIERYFRKGCNNPPITQSLSQYNDDDDDDDDNNNNNNSNKMENHILLFLYRFT